MFNEYDKTFSAQKQFGGTKMWAGYCFQLASTAAGLFYAIARIKLVM